MDQQLRMDVDKLLQDLQSADAYIRKTAAEEMGKLNSADDRVLGALKTVADADDNKYVRSAATQSYLSLGGKPLMISKEIVKEKKEIVKEKDEALALLAGKKLASRLPYGRGYIISIKKTKEAKSGFLGIGATLPEYEVEIGDLSDADIETLIHIVRCNDDEETRRSASSLLVSKADFQAIKAIVDIVENDKESLLARELFTEALKRISITSPEKDKAIQTFEKVKEEYYHRVTVYCPKKPRSLISAAELNAYSTWGTLAEDWVSPYEYKVVEYVKKNICQLTPSDPVELLWETVNDISEKRSELVKATVTGDFCKLADFTWHTMKNDVQMVVKWSLPMNKQ